MAFHYVSALGQQHATDQHNQQQKPELLHRALLVGINYAHSDCALSGCINDVNAVRDMLVSDMHWQPCAITVLCERDATRHGILNALKNLVTECNALLRGKPNARLDVWLHYSGHGSQVVTRSPGERDGSDETIVPYDYLRNGQITDSDLAHIFSELNPAARLTTVFDCCHSGTILDLPYTFGPRSGLDGPFMPSAPDRPIQTSQWSLNSNVVCLSGCRDTQTSADYDGAGAMTTALLDVLRRSNFRITLKDLLRELRDTLKGNRLVRGGFSQIAQLSASRLMASDTLFVNRAGHGLRTQGTQGPQGSANVCDDVVCMCGY